jgi:hypothetical protein
MVCNSMLMTPGQLSEESRYVMTYYKMSIEYNQLYAQLELYLYMLGGSKV